MDRALIVGPGECTGLLYVDFRFGLYLDYISFGSREGFYVRLGRGGGVCLFVDIVLGRVGISGVSHGWA